MAKCGILIIILLYSNLSYSEDVYNPEVLRRYAEPLIEMTNRYIEYDRNLIAQGQFVERHNFNVLANQSGDLLEIPAGYEEAKKRASERSDDCFAMAHGAETLEALVVNCKVPKVDSTCESVDLQIKNLTTNSSINTAQLLQNSGSAAAIRTANQVLGQLKGQLDQLINYNKQCSAALAEMMQDDCFSTYRRFFSDYNKRKELIPMYCTPQGIENMLTMFEGRMTHDRGPAKRVFKTAQTHIVNRNKEIRLAKDIIRLSEFVYELRNPDQIRQPASGD